MFGAASMVTVSPTCFKTPAVACCSASVNTWRVSDGAPFRFGLVSVIESDAPSFLTTVRIS